MKFFLAAVTLSSSLVSTSSFADSAKLATQAEPARFYSTGGFARIVIDRPAQVAFYILTDVNRWPEINLGVTKEIDPAGLRIAKGVRFRETIASPAPGLEDWTNEWIVEDYDPQRKRFVISGRDNFAKTPVYVRITYTFAELGPASTLYKRKVEATIDERFMKEASKPEIAGLAAFLGSQWVMARHLKTFIQAHSKP